MSRLRHLALVAGLLLVVAGSARADSILYTIGTLAKTSVSGGTKWDYKFDVSSDATVQKGDFFVIVDFGGYVAGSIFAPSNWTAIVEGTTAAVVASNTNATGVTVASDSAGDANLRFTYDGPPIAVAGPTSLGDFGAITTLTGERNGFTVAMDHNVQANATEANTGFAPVPVPLPATANMGLILLGSIAGLGLVRRLRNGPAVVA